MSCFVFFLQRVGDHLFFDKRDDSQFGECFSLSLCLRVPVHEGRVEIQGERFVTAAQRTHCYMYVSNPSIVNYMYMSCKPELDHQYQLELARSYWQVLLAGLVAT